MAETIRSGSIDYDRDVSEAGKESAELSSIDDEVPNEAIEEEAADPVTDETDRQPISPTESKPIEQSLAAQFRGDNVPDIDIAVKQAQSAAEDDRQDTPQDVSPGRQTAEGRDKKKRSGKRLSRSRNKAKHSVNAQDGRTRVDKTRGQRRSRDRRRRRKEETDSSLSSDDTQSGLNTASGSSQSDISDSDSIRSSITKRDSSVASIKRKRKKIKSHRRRRSADESFSESEKSDKRHKRKSRSARATRDPDSVASESVTPGSDSVDNEQAPRQTQNVEDVSEWGRVAIPELYAYGAPSSTKNSLSSGVSPRDTRPAMQKWIAEDACRSLAYNSATYGAMVSTQKESPFGNDLPIRIAYQHLTALAGMAGKVQDVILHNKLIFEKRIVHRERALRCRALYAWKEVLERRRRKIRVLSRAGHRIERGLLLRSFDAWLALLSDRDRTSCKLKKAVQIQRKGLLKRCIERWQVLCVERSWKNRVQSCERENRQLQNQLRSHVHRRLALFTARHRRKLVDSWHFVAIRSKARRLAENRASKHYEQNLRSRALSAWLRIKAESYRRRKLIAKTLKRIDAVRSAYVLNAWSEMMEANKTKRHRADQALLLSRRWCVHRSFAGWILHLRDKRDEKRRADSWKRPLMVKVFEWLRDWAAHKKSVRSVVERARAKIAAARFQTSFRSWMRLQRDAREARLIGRLEKSAVEIEQLQAENARLRLDNERFVQLIDSGDWGKSRVEELNKAGEVLRSQRDALSDLVEQLRQEHDAVERERTQQAEELKQLKEKIVSGGSRSPAIRNKMLVKGASSFNSLVRALKQDLVDQRSAATDPALLLEIDKLAMDRVHVFPDGELKIEAVRKENDGTKPRFA